MESPTAPSAPRPDQPRPAEPARQSEADRRFQQTAAEIYRPDPNLGPSTETFRALSDPLNDPVPSRNSGAGGGYPSAHYGSNGSGYPSASIPVSSDYPGRSSYEGACQKALEATPITSFSSMGNGIQGSCGLD